MTRRWRTLGPSLACAGWLAWPVAVASAATGPVAERTATLDDLEVDLALLDAADPATFAQVRSRLEARGEPALARALEGFEGLEPRARRARARLLAGAPTPALLPRVLTLLADPDPLVRESLARFLGDLALADAGIDERLHALAGRVAADPDRRVRAAALEALAAAHLPGTARALDELLDRVDDREVEPVAQALADLAEGRRLLVDRVQRAFAEGVDGASPATGATLEAEGLVVLVEAYGRALAELPEGGLEARDRRPFRLGIRHADARVEAATWVALQGALARLTELVELERAEAFLAALGDEGFPRYDLLYRRASLALAGRGDAADALALARSLARAAELAPLEDRPTYRYYALHFEGAALFGLGRAAEAGRSFEAAERLAREMLGERLDRLDDESRVQLSRGGGIMVERLHLVALLELWRAVCLLADGAEPGSPAVLERCRAAHAELLRAQVMARRTNARTNVRSIDLVLARDLAPGPLVLFNRKVELWTAQRAYALLEDLGRALATVAPAELPGFEPIPGAGEAHADPLLDPERFVLLFSARAEHVRQLGRDLSFVETPEEERNVRMLRQYLRNQEQREDEALRAAGAPGGGRQPVEVLQRFLATLTAEERRTIYFELLGLREPSLLAYDLGQHLRQDGHSDEARRLGTRLLEDLAQHPPGASDVWTEWASARTELMIGSSWMDADRPLEAERVSLNAVRRLEEIENTIRAQGGGAIDEARQALIDQVQGLRSNALLSLAVNANVRMGDQERALEYFERAYELDQRDFMQVLYACYRARSGRTAEARAVLAGVRPAPPLYYNLACTHALLGDLDLAVDYLQRELEENHPTPEGLARQRAWAASDPDLAALREHPRFLALVPEARGE